MRVAAILAVLLVSLLPAGNVVAAPPPAAPVGLVLELAPTFRGPSPHLINFHWLVAEDAAGYGWEVERNFPGATGSGVFEPWITIAPELTFPGDLANAIDDQTPPGVRVCFRVRAAAPTLQPGAWSAAACGDLAQVPQALPMLVAASVGAEGVTVSWQALPAADLGYWPQMAQDHVDGRRDWLGITIVPQGDGRLSAFAPVPSIPARWCFRVIPILSTAVSVSSSEEFCLDYSGDNPVTPSPTGTPSAPSVGNGLAMRESSDPEVRMVGAVMLLLGGLLAFHRRRA
ncbi:MAG: hypothetical protein ABI577_03515 [bacterium]